MSKAQSALLRHPDCTIEVLTAFLTGKENDSVRLPEAPDDFYEDPPAHRDSGLRLTATSDTWRHTLLEMFRALEDKGADFDQMLAVFQHDHFRKGFWGHSRSPTLLRKAFLRLTPQGQLDRIVAQVHAHGAPESSRVAGDSLSMEMLNWFVYQTLDRAGPAYHFGRVLLCACLSPCMSPSNEADKQTVLLILGHIRSLLSPPPH